MCSAEIAELSSVKKKSFSKRTTQQKNARSSFKRKIIRSPNVPDKNYWSNSPILENEGKNGQKTPTVDYIVRNHSFSPVSEQIASKNQPHY